MPQKNQGEKELGGKFSFHRFLETHQSFTYWARSITENNFVVKKRLIREEIPAHGLVLDIACGGGFLLEAIGRPESYAGVDLSDKVIRHAKRNYEGVFFRMDARRLAFRDETFESCVAMDIFHHIRDADIDAILEDVCRVLTPGGRVIVTDPLKAEWLKDPALKFFQVLDRGDCFRTQEELGALLSRRFKISKQAVQGSGIAKWQIYILTKR